MASHPIYNFEEDYKRLKKIPDDKLSLSTHLSHEVIIGGMERYIELYSYFWQLIDENQVHCEKCQTQSCYNRYFLIELKESGFTENDLYILTYMTAYFLDLIIKQGVSLPQAYYILSKGHDYVLSFVLGKKSFPLSVKRETIENYQGYLLGVLYYLLPNFKYELKISPN